MEKLMCDGTIFPCIFDSAVVLKSKSLRMHTRLLSFSAETMMRTVMHMIRINPSISRFSIYINIRTGVTVEYALLHLRAQECCGTILVISVRKSVSIQNIVTVSGARRGGAVIP